MAAKFTWEQLNERRLQEKRTREEAAKKREERRQRAQEKKRLQILEDINKGIKALKLK